MPNNGYRLPGRKTPYFDTNAGSVGWRWLHRERRIGQRPTRVSARSDGIGEDDHFGYATGELSSKLSGLELCEGVTTQSGGWVSGEVSIGERKSKL